MESDTVRTIGDSTMVDIWLKGRMRNVSVTRDAIQSFLKLTPQAMDDMSDEERSEFVRRNLSSVASAALAWLNANPGQDAVVIEAGQLVGPGRSAPGERRAGDRRKGDRRQKNLGPPGTERRRS